MYKRPSKMYNLTILVIWKDEPIPDISILYYIYIYIYFFFLTALHTIGLNIKCKRQ